MADVKPDDVFYDECDRRQRGVGKVERPWPSTFRQHPMFACGAAAGTLGRALYHSLKLIGKKQGGTRNNRWASFVEK